VDPVSIETIGVPESFELLCKSTMPAHSIVRAVFAYEIPGMGCLVQVSSKDGNQIAEALTFVSGVKIVGDINGGRRLVSMYAPPEGTSNADNQ
jgi:hypothetical protein